MQSVKGSHLYSFVHLSEWDGSIRLHLFQCKISFVSINFFMKITNFLQFGWNPKMMPKCFWLFEILRIIRHHHTENNPKVEIYSRSQQLVNPMPSILSELWTKWRVVLSLNAPSSRTLSNCHRPQDQGRLEGDLITHIFKPQCARAQGGNECWN